MIVVSVVAYCHVRSSIDEGSLASLASQPDAEYRTQLTAESDLNVRADADDKLGCQ